MLQRQQQIEKANIISRTTAPPTEAIRITSSIIKKGGGGVMGGRGMLAAVVTFEPLITVADGVLEGRVSIEYIVSDEP